MADGNVQHISELGFDLSAAMQQLEELERLIREKSISLSKLAKVNWSMEGALEIAGVTQTFKTLEQQAAKVNDVIGMSRAKAKEAMASVDSLGLQLTKYFKQNGKKTAVEWSKEFQEEFPRGMSDLRKNLAPYLKWTDDGTGIGADTLTNEIQSMFPQLGEYSNHVAMWERINDEIKKYRAELNELTTTGANTYFEKLQQDASGATTSIERMVDALEKTYKADSGVGKDLMSEGDIKAMAAGIEQAANVQTKITTETDKTGQVTKVMVGYVDELNRTWQETYKWVSQVDEESGETAEGFQRIKAVATESADSAKKLADEFNKIQLATENMNLGNIKIFEHGGDVGQADKLRGINAQMVEIKQSAESITRSDVERAKNLQYQSQLIAVAAKEEKARQQTTAESARLEKQAAAEQVKYQMEVTAQYSKVASIQKEIRVHNLDTGGSAAQLNLIRQQSEELYRKLQIGEKITQEEREQLDTNQQLLNQIQAQVNVAKSDAAQVASSKSTFGEIAKSIGIYGSGYMAFHELKQGAIETVKTMRDVETSMMEIARVMELTAAQSNSLRNSLFATAGDMGREFADTSEIMLRFAQAGYDVAEASEMTRTALLAMNTAELDAVNSTDSMIGILQQWKLEAADLATVIDKLNYTADANAITTQDLVDGLLRSSSAAKNAKFSFDETVGALVAMREATGRSGKEIGTALNSLIAFTQRGKSQDVFESLGVKVYADEAKTSLVPLLEVWEELSKLVQAGGEESINALTNIDGMAELLNKDMAETVGMQKEYNELFAEGLTDVQKMDVYTQSGVFRKNYWIALLENFGKIQEVVTDMDDAMGHSARENARYMETLEAKTNQLVTSLKALAVQAGEAGFMDLAKGALEAAIAVSGLIKGVGGVIPVLITLTAVLAMVKRESIANLGVEIYSGFAKNIQSASDSLGILKVVSQEAGGGVKGFGAAIKYAGVEASAAIGPTGWIILLITAISLVSAATEEYNRKQSEFRQQAIEAGNAAREQVAALEQLARTHENLLELGASSNDERYLSLQGEITDALGGRAKQLSDLTIGTEEYATALQGVIEQEYEYIAAALEAKRIAQETELIRASQITDRREMAAGGPAAQLTNVVTAQKSAEQLVAEYFKLLDLQSEIFGGEDYKKGEEDAVRYFDSVNAQIVKNEEQAKAYHKTMIEGIALEYQRSNGYITTSEELENLREYLYESTGATESQQIAIDKLLSVMLPMAKLTSDSADGISSMAERLADSAKEIERLNEAIDSIQSSYQLLSSATEAYNDTGFMSIDMLQSVLNLSPEYLAALNFENGQIVINTQRIQELTEALKQEAITKLQNAAVSDIKALADGRVEEMSNLAKDAVASLGNNAATAGSQMSEGAKGAFDFAAGVAAIMAAEGIDTSKIKSEANAIVGAYQIAANNINRIKIDFGAGSVTGASTAAASKANAAALKAETDAINAKIKAQEKAKKVSDEYYDNEIDKIQRAQKAADRLNDDIIDGLKERQKARAEYWDDQEKSVKDSYDAEIKALQDLKKASSRGDERADYLKSRAELEAERADMQKRTSREAVERIKEIDKSLADLDEEESRRLRDIDIEDRISDIEAERDSELAAIKESAAEEDKRYENKIASIEKVAEMEKRANEDEIQRLKDVAEEEKKGFEAVIESLREQIEAAKNASDNQVASTGAVGNAHKSMAELSEERINWMYKMISQGSHDWALKAIQDGESVFSVYNRLVQKIQEAQAGKVYGPVQGGSLQSFNVYGPQQGTSFAFDLSKYKSSHTGSLVTADGLVNVQAGEIIVRKDISDSIQQRMRQDNTTNNSTSNITNAKTQAIKVDMRGAQIGTGVSSQRAGADIGDAILRKLGSLS